MKTFLITVLFPLFILFYLSGCSKVDDKTLLAAHKAVENGAVIIDVRTYQEYIQHHIPNAINISIEELSKSVARVPKNKILIVYCHSGSRSSVATKILSQRGWKVYDVATENEYNRKVTQIE